LFLSGQQKQRISATYSIKEIDTLGQNKISMGELFFSNSSRVLRFEQKFPDTRSYILQDTVLNITKQNSKQNISISKGLIDYNIYNLILAGSIQDFGLSKSGYILEKVKEEEGLIIMVYVPPKAMPTISKIELVKKEGKLEGFIVYNEKGVLISQTFFREYVLKDGVLVPMKIIQFLHYGTKQSKKITTLKDVKINETTRIHLYRP
jgi:hypothetical protein